MRAKIKSRTNSQQREGYEGYYESVINPNGFSKSANNQSDRAEQPDWPRCSQNKWKLGGKNLDRFNN